MYNKQVLQRKALAVAIAALTLSPIGARLGWAEDKKAVQLEQVIVTAQKSDDRIQDIASTINLVSGDLLSQMEITRFADLAQVTAGVSFDVLTGRRQSLNMRGVQTNPDGGFADGVAVYWNDMNVRTDVAFQQLFDIDRVEVLRGPQGTLQGATSPAGAIQIHTRMPYLDGFRGNVEQTFSNNGGSNTEFGVDLPIIQDQLALRVAGVYDSSDINDARNLTTGQRLTTMTRAGRMSLMYQPGDVFTARLAYEYLEKTADGGEILAGPALGGNPALDPSDRKVLASIDNLNTNRNQLTSLNLSWDLGQHQVTWETGYYKSRQISLLDADTGNVKSGYTANLIPVTGERFLQELRLSSQLSDRWDSLVGFYYQNDKSRAVAYLAPTSATTTVNDIPSHGETYALFTHQKFQITDSSLIEAGLRYQKVNQYNASDILIYLNATGNLYTSIRQIPDNEAHNADAEVVTGSLKYSYTFSPDLMAYVSYDQSFRPGGVTPTTVAVNSEYLSYDDEKSQGLELGVKSTWLDNRLRVNADIFYQQFSNGLYRSQGLSVYTTKPETVRLVYNADSIVQGAELEVEGLVTENWRLATNISYVDAKYDDATIPCNANASSNLPGVVSMCTSSGRAGTEPNWSATASSFYTLPLGPVDAYANVLMKYQGFRDDDTLVNSRIGGFTTTNLYLGVRDADNVWDISVWVKNLFDKDTEAVPAEITETTYLRVRPNERRTVGITAKYNFGSTR